MKTGWRILTAAVVLLVTVLCAGCPGAAAPAETATVWADADLAPAFDAGVTVSSVGVTLAGDQEYAFNLDVNVPSRTATGSRTGVTLGDYTATITVSDGSSTVGSATGAVSVRGDTTITVTIVVDDPAGGGSIEIGLE